MAAELKVTSLPDAVYGALRESILSSADAPGSIFTEAAVALRFGVARPTAKAAIERLVGEGLLHRSAHRTAQIPVFTEDDIADLYDSRAVIEVAALRKLAANSHIPTEALAAHRGLIAAAHSVPSASFARDDIAFHRALVVGQSSPRLARMHELIMGEIELSIGQVDSHRLLTASDVAEQHLAILDAVASGNVELAGERTRTHIVTARDRLLGFTASTQPEAQPQPKAM